MIRALIAIAMLVSATAGCATKEREEAKAPSLSDLSGVTWLGGDRFIAVHDAKNPREIDRPRVSILTLPVSLDGIGRIPVAPTFPGGASSDLEAVAAIPGTTKFLLAESGDDAGSFDRIFLAEVRKDAVDILGAVRWRDFTRYGNIEAVAVARAKSAGWILLWAERNSGSDSTELKWARLSLEPFRVAGPVAAVPFRLPASARDVKGNALYNRTIVAMDIDAEGRIYAAAALDPETVSPEPNNGPFRSMVYRLGRVEGDRMVLDREPMVLGVLDGLKVESLAVREEGGRRQIFVGTDDENYGGILRLLPSPGAHVR